MPNPLEKFKTVRKFGPGSDIKKTIVSVCIYDKDKQLQYDFVSRDRQGLSYDSYRDFIISTIIKIPQSYVNDKIGFMKKYDLFAGDPDIAYAKTKNRRYFDMIIDVSNPYEK